MVTTATAAGQLAGECSIWTDSLRSYRNTLQHYKSKLLLLAIDQTSRDVLLEIGHLDNQFYIQLINIHDLKHAIKKHMQKISSDKGNNRHIPDEVLARHEYLFEEYQQLEHTLMNINNEFDHFVKYCQA